MIFVEFVYYLTIIFTTALKGFAVSIIPIQELTSQYITCSGIIYIFFNVSNLLDKELIRYVLGYGILIALSAIFAYPAITWLQFSNSLIFPILFLVSSIFFSHQPDKFKYLKYIGLVGIVLAYYNLLRLSAAANLRTTHLIQNNAGNALVALAPFAFLWKKEYIRVLLLSLIFFGCLVSLKRSGILIFLIICISYITIKNHKGLISSSIIYCVLALFIIYLIMLNTEGGTILLERLQNATSDGGSGRDSLIVYCIKLLHRNNLAEWLFGNGYESFRSNMWFYYNRRFTCTHNDYFEVLYSSGLIAVVLFVVIIWKQWKYSKRLYENSNWLTVSFASGTITLIGASLMVCSFVHIWYYLLLYCLMGALYVVTQKDFEYEKDIIPHVY